MIVIALGSNQGDRARSLRDACREVERTLGPLVAVSAVSETPPWGVTDQPHYLNQVVIVDHGVTAGQGLTARLHGLLDTCQAIERRLGRRPGRRWGPRPCDVDLILVDDLHFEDHRLSLPHPWWRQRAFVAGLLRRDLAAEFNRYWPQHRPDPAG